MFHDSFAYKNITFCSLSVSHSSLIRQDLVGVEDSLWVKDLLELLHDPDRTGGLGEVDEVALLEAKT